MSTLPPNKVPCEYLYFSCTPQKNRWNYFTTTFQQFFYHIFFLILIIFYQFQLDLCNYFDTVPTFSIAFVIKKHSRFSSSKRLLRRNKIKRTFLMKKSFLTAKINFVRKTNHFWPKESFLPKKSFLTAKINFDRENHFDRNVFQLDLYNYFDTVPIRRNNFFVARIKKNVPKKLLWQMSKITVFF